MNKWQIAWRSIQQRGLASVLTSFSMALGVMLVVAVLSIYGVVSQQFRNNASLGYNMIVGAQGGKLQLTLNSVYYLSQPIENVDYEFYLEFFGQEERDDHLRNSFRYEAHQATWDTVGLQTVAAGSVMPGAGLLGSVVADLAAEQIVADRLDLGRGGRFESVTGYTIPLALGDYFGRFRVVGTIPEMFEYLVANNEDGTPYEFADGRNFETWNEKHGYFEAVAGATVAREMKVKVGDRFSPAHGDPDGHGHDRDFVVVGILEPTGTPNDRAMFVNLEGFYLMADHAKPLDAPDEEEGEEAAPAEDDEKDEDADAAEEVGDGPGPAEADSDSEAHFRVRERLPLEQREVTSMLLRTANPFVAARLQNVINEGDEAQAVQPVKEIYDLLDLIVRPVQLVLLVLTAMICVVSGVSILVSIYNSMNDRKKEIAVMRALGARRTTVMAIIVLEAIMLSLVGGVLGWVGGHGLNVVASGFIEARTGVQIGFFDFAPEVDVAALLGGSAEIAWLQISSEFLLIPALMLLAVIVGFVPAWTAYKTDVSESLGK